MGDYAPNVVEAICSVAGALSLLIEVRKGQSPTMILLYAKKLRDAADALESIANGKHPS